uniref:Transmembrane protein n=1 Tax=Macrostomum lignano TaxID=282301 RepID=A0A1I8JRB7_9PLAT
MHLPEPPERPGCEMCASERPADYLNAADENEYEVANIQAGKYPAGKYLAANIQLANIQLANITWRISMANIQLANIRAGEYPAGNIQQANIQLANISAGKYPAGDISSWQNIQLANIQAGEYPAGKYPAGKYQLQISSCKYPAGKYPAGKYPGWRISSWQISRLANIRLANIQAGKIFQRQYESIFNNSEDLSATSFAQQNRKQTMLGSRAPWPGVKGRSLSRPGRIYLTEHDQPSPLIELPQPDSDAAPQPPLRARVMCLTVTAAHRPDHLGDVRRRLRCCSRLARWPVVLQEETILLSPPHPGGWAEQLSSARRLCKKQKPPSFWAWQRQRRLWWSAWCGFGLGSAQHKQDSQADVRQLPAGIFCASWCRGRLGRLREPRGTRTGRTATRCAVSYWVAVAAAVLQFLAFLLYIMRSDFKQEAPQEAKP